MAVSYRKLLRKSAWICFLGTIGAFAAGLGVLAVIISVVFFGDDSHLSEEEIKARITEETSIYMLDEQRQIGSFFDNAHRNYVSIDDIPAHMINAIIASEDKNFYHHHGVDPVAIVSAGLGVLKGGRIRGASTLTQQTVRNILGWFEVTVSRKFREWIAAIQLERRFEKRQILEFYLNQFYVSGNGNGIGIAAKYYFNKDVRDLDLVESAFIAGSVKGPSLYDPFIQFTKERQERAIQRAFERKNYVLDQMFEQRWIDEEQYKEAREKPVKFSRGRFRSTEVALTQIIKDELNKKGILEALGIEDPREIAGAGFKVYTTIDGDLQEGAQIAMRRNLSRLETLLEGYETEKEDRFKKLRSLIVNDYYYGQVTEIGGKKGEPTLTVSFGLPTCTIPFESLMRRAKIMDLAWGKGWQKQLDEMMKVIKVGEIVFAEVLEYDPESHTAVCELHRRPRVNGGMVAIDKGEVRAVISGFDTKGYNRATQAKRQPGSVFKPVVYFAALQLGWSILDRLDNQRQVFPFQGRFYYPQPDHQTPFSDSSMLWAGIMSENLASIALTSRLVEKLNFKQFKDLMGHMGLLPNPGEAPRDYHFRVAKKVGVQLDNDGVKEFQLRNAIDDLMLDVQYTSGADFKSKIAKLWWGRGYSNELQAIYQTDDDLSVTRRAERIMLVQNNYLRMKDIGDNLAADWNAIQAMVEEKGNEAAFQDPSIQHLIERFRVLPGMSAKPALGYYVRLERDVPRRAVPDQDELEKLLVPAGRVLNPLDMHAIWGGNVIFGSADISLGDVKIDGWFPYQHLTSLGGYIEQHYAEITARQEEYDLHRYWQHHDFRIALGLEYLVALTRAMGVKSKLEPVPSYPLGTNEVTAAEVALIYQTFVSGKVYRYYEEGPPNQLNYIRRIEDRYGNVLFEPERTVKELVKDSFALQMREILRRIVTHGTGRVARGELYVTYGPKEGETVKGKAPGKEERIRVPAFGKTGTTNDYTNAYFAGFLPYPTEKNEPLDPDNSYVIASYVGYDLNKPMKAGYKQISGASGALPAWIGLGQAAIEKKKYSEFLDNLDINILATKTWPLKFDERTTPLQIDMPVGVILNRRGLDDEVYGTTNIATEGEDDFNEFRANVVEATLRLPLDGQGSPQRVFAPFVDLEDEEQKILESKVEPSASAQRINQELSTGTPTPPNGSVENAAEDGDDSAEDDSVNQKLDDLFGSDDSGEETSPNVGNQQQIQAATGGSQNSKASPQPKPTPKSTPPPLTDPEDIFGDLNNPEENGEQDGGDSDSDNAFDEEELW